MTIGASNPDLMERFIEKDDLVILGNRYESRPVQWTLTPAVW